MFMKRHLKVLCSRNLEFALLKHHVNEGVPFKHILQVSPQINLSLMFKRLQLNVTSVSSFFEAIHLMFYFEASLKTSTQICITDLKY
jgi:hypothetical protein